MILYKSSIKLPEGLEKRIVDDSKKEFNSITSYTLKNGCVDGYFYKKIDMIKARQRYDGNYTKLLIEYYKKLKQVIKCNELFEVFETDGEVYEVAKLIDKKELLCDNNDITFEEMKKLFYMVLDDIGKLEKCGNKTLGIDSAIWNYTKSGIFFDYDPPKIFRGESLFIPQNDIDYRKRVLYRNFDYNGMRANTMGTIFLGNENWNFNITELPKDYAKEIVDIFLSSLTKKEDVEKFKQEIYGNRDVDDFDKHPINIVRKELRK